MLKDKKMVRIVALGVTLLFLLGVAGIAFTQSGSKMASAAGNPSSNIGVVTTT